IEEKQLRSYGERGGSAAKHASGPAPFTCKADERNDAVVQHSSVGFRRGLLGLGLLLQHHVENHFGAGSEESGESFLIDVRFFGDYHWRRLRMQDVILSLICSAVKGLRTYPCAPSSTACRTLVLLPSVVIMITGICFQRFSERRRDSSCNPSIF